MWCDGFEARFLDPEAHRIRGRAWVGLGPRSMERWTFELLLPHSVSTLQEVAWSDLLPPNDVTAWLSVDPDRKHLVIAPDEAVPESA